jgi:hypothetical protein
VYDVGHGEGNNDEGLNYYDSGPLNLNVYHDPNEVDNNVVYCFCNNVPTFEVELP